MLRVSTIIKKRIKHLSTISKYHDFSSGGDFSDNFDLPPTILIFQNWEISNQYSSTITIRNKAKKVNYISLSMGQSDIFSVSPSKPRKLSSCSCLTYTIKFNPSVAVDFTMKIILHSDRLPIIIKLQILE